jgi:AcrR family transcriptional regulator
MDRLPRGRHGLPPEFVAENQRQRLIAGLTETLYEVGYRKTTVSLIGKRASVSKSDFYKHFRSKDECFMAAYEAAINRIREAVREACERDPNAPWPPRVRDALAAAITLLEREPQLAAIVLAEGLRAGRGVYDRYQLALDGFVAYLRQGAPAPPGGGTIPAATDEAVIGGIASLLGRRIVAGEGDIDVLLPQLLEFALTPYLGSAEARRIVSAG